MINGGSVLHLDFETRSVLDLRKVGLHRYADPYYTEVLCCAYAFDDEPVKLLEPGAISIEIIDHIVCGREVAAHNATFEFELWNKVFYPAVPLKLEQMTCTMAQAFAMGLPGTLAGCAAALGISQQKDLEGSRIMMQLCKPKDILEDGTIIWWDDPEKYKRLYEYCKQDVVVEREVGKRMFKLSPYEKRVWILDQQINARGIQVDRKAVENAVKLVETQKDTLDQRMRSLTNDSVATCNALQQLKDHLEFYGVYAESLDKPSVLELIENPKTHPHAKAVLELRAQGGKAATAKLSAMLDGIGEDNRLRGCFQYSGANTRRWSGRRVQLQNLKRPSFKHSTIEQIVDNIANGMSADMLDLSYGPPLGIIGDCTRAFLTAAPGSDLITCDFSAIEARKLAWLAGQDDVLEVFRSERDIYKVAAMAIFRVPYEKVTDTMRQVGKVAVLALGYQGGVGAFQQMAKGYGVKMEPAFAELWAASDYETKEFALKRFADAGSKYEISKEEFLASEITKINWRRSNPRICEYWAAAETAFISAIMEPGRVFSIGNDNRAVRFKKAGSFMWTQLPSGGVICYPYPEIRETKTPWGAKKYLPTYMSEDQGHKWVRFSTYGGSIVENITQASSRDLLADALLRLDEKKYSIVAHVHDEIVCEMTRGSGSLEEMESIMSENPKWAKNLPLASAGWREFRYRK